MSTALTPRRIFFQVVTATLSLIVVFTSLLSPAAHARTASDINSQISGGPWFSSAAEDCAAGITNSGSAATGTTIVLDPGHAPGTDTQVDSQSNIAVFDSENNPEMAQTWSVAETVAQKLLKDGYTVLFTKKSVNDATTDLKKRTQTAYTATADKSGKITINPTPAPVSNASLGVSIHTTPAASTANAVFEPNAGTFTNGKHNAKTGNWRITADGQTKKYYGDLPNADKLSQTDKAVGEKMAAARSTALGGTKVQSGAYDAIMNGPRDTSIPGIHSVGTVLVSEYFATIPWVYNEQAQDGNASISSATQTKYANGLIAGIEDIVPKPSSATNGDTSNSVTSGSTTVTMDKVDLSGFKPDPKAVSLFNKEGLPQIKKFLSSYINAAKAEGVLQNWEILPALQWPESNFSNSFKSNNLGYTGPYQEGPGELAEYLGKKDYDPPLNTLVTSGGKAIQNNKLTDAQFETLSRLVFKHWISGSGLDYDALKKGPIAFNPSVNSSNVFWKIMHRWNSGAEHYEAFNGYNTTDSPMGLPTEQGTSFSLPGAATTYYLLKQWEASGGMSTITVSGAADNCGDGTPSDSGSPDCQAAVGNEKILCNAKKYDPVTYSESIQGNHYPDGRDTTWLKTCPTINASCYLDCSGLVSIAVYDSFGLDKTWNTYALMGDSTNWKRISLSDLKPGDVILPNAGHVEVVDHVQGATIYTFGAHYHHPNNQSKDVSPGSFQTSGIQSDGGAYRYVGKGAGT